MRTKFWCQWGLSNVSSHFSTFKWKQGLENMWMIMALDTFLYWYSLIMLLSSHSFEISGSLVTGWKCTCPWAASVHFLIFIIFSLLDSNYIISLSCDFWELYIYRKRMIIKKHILKRAWNYKQLGSMNNYLSSFLVDSWQVFFAFSCIACCNFTNWISFAATACWMTWIWSWNFFFLSSSTK